MNRDVIKKAVLAVVAVGVLGGFGGSTYYFYDQYRKSQALLADPAAAAAEEIRRLTASVGEHLYLPQDEVPTVATVSDKTKLADQPFFALSEPGDKVLIFSKAGRVVLYRPQIDKVIEVTAVTPGSAVAGTQTEAAQIQTARLAIWNGTATVGLASVVEARLKAGLPVVTTIAKTNSVAKYEQTTVVVIKPEARELGTKLSQQVGGRVVDKLPEGEAAVNADLVLILGSDYQI